MFKELPKRLTYAQRKLVRLIEERKLREFSIANGITHTTLYKLATTDRFPTYKVISSLVHVISPIEWLFYEDEELPYEPVLLPGWDYDKTCHYVKAHEKEWSAIAKKYGIDSSTSYKLFSTKEIYPPIKLMRNVCPDTNPIEFFVEDLSQKDDNARFNLKRGDVAMWGNKYVLVLTDEKFFKKHKAHIACKITDGENDFAIKINSNAGTFANPYELVTILAADNAYSIENVNDKALENISKALSLLAG